jgi:hypothetical protein
LRFLAGAIFVPIRNPEKASSLFLAREAPHRPGVHFQLLFERCSHLSNEQRGAKADRFFETRSGFPMDSSACAYIQSFSRKEVFQAARHSQERRNLVRSCLTKEVGEKSERTSRNYSTANAELSLRGNTMLYWYPLFASRNSTMLTPAVHDL